MHLGYFSSNAIKVLSSSFAQFIYNGGTIDFLINAYAVGILSYGVDLLEMGANTIGGEKFGDRPTLREGDINIWKDPMSIFKNVFTVNIIFLKKIQ